MGNYESILFGAGLGVLCSLIVGALAYLARTWYLENKERRKRTKLFNELVKDYKPVLINIKNALPETCGKIISLQASGTLLLCGIKNRRIINDSDKKIDAKTFVSDLFSRDFIFQMDLDTSLTSGSTGPAISVLGNRKVKYAMSNDFISLIKELPD
jgi:hypothetical protein